MKLFNKFASLTENYDALLAAGADPFNVRLDRILSPTEAVVGNRHTILAGTNNYLGLTFDPAVIEASRQAASDEGAGTTGSRVANGTYAGHRALEGELAEFLGMKGCIVFTTGYQANVGVLSTLAGPRDTVLLDADCHASIYDAVRMGGSQVIRFRHNDVGDLEKRISRLAASEDTQPLIIVEGIYSMLGDKAPLKEIIEIKKRHGAALVVDEAHSLGVLGPTGRGLFEELDVAGDVDFVLGTFSKSLGAIGGYCASNLPQLDILRVACRAYMFTASLPPTIIASVREALRQIQSRPELREQLWRNAHQFHGGLAERGFAVGPTVAPITGVRLDSVPQAIAFWNMLLEEGVYVNLALPPATPSNTPLLRCSVCAAHRPEQIDTVLAAFDRVRDRLVAMERAAAQSEMAPA